MLELLVFAQPYYDPQGLIVAHIGPRVVGFVHAAFGVNAAESALDYDAGVIAAVMVHPEFRRQGIARQLVARAEAYLRGKGAQSIQAGSAAPLDPFYLGLYGGAELSGFLDSDVAAAPFFAALGYQPAERRLVMQRDLEKVADPVDFRLVNLRRTVQLGLTDQPAKMTWWWTSRLGRFESFRFLLLTKKGGHPLAEATCFGLDLFSKGWQKKTVALTGLGVVESERRKGLAKVLLIDVFRRLRQEGMACVEAHVTDTNEAGLSVLKSFNFHQVDAGTIYSAPHP